MLLVGGVGQLGQSLAPALAYMYGRSNVLVTDVHESKDLKVQLPAEYTKLNALDYQSYNKVIEDFSPSVVLHLSAILSGRLRSYGRKKRW